MSKEYKKWDLIHAYLPSDGSGMWINKEEHGSSITLNYQAKIEPCLIINIDALDYQVIPMITSENCNENFCVNLDNLPEFTMLYKHSTIQCNKIIRIGKQSVKSDDLDIGKVLDWHMKNKSEYLNKLVKNEKVFYHTENKEEIPLKHTTNGETKIYLKVNFEESYKEKLKEIKEMMINFLEN